MGGQGGMRGGRVRAALSQNVVGTKHFLLTSEHPFLQGKLRNFPGMLGPLQAQESLAKLHQISRLEVPAKRQTALAKEFLLLRCQRQT